MIAKSDTGTGDVLQLEGVGFEKRDLGKGSERPPTAPQALSMLQHTYRLVRDPSGSVEIIDPNNLLSL
eukprot:1009801-Pyramimonas_sp.AAC.1